MDQPPPAVLPPAVPEPEPEQNPGHVNYITERFLSHPDRPNVVGLNSSDHVAAAIARMEDFDRKFATGA